MIFSILCLAASAVFAEVKYPKCQVALTDMATVEAILESLPAPGTPLTATASVFFTGESLPGGDSMVLRLLVAREPSKNALAGKGSSLANTNFTDFTLAVRTKMLLEV